MAQGSQLSFRPELSDQELRGSALCAELPSQAARPPRTLFSCLLLPYPVPPVTVIALPNCKTG